MTTVSTGCKSLCAAVPPLRVPSDHYLACVCQCTFHRRARSDVPRSSVCYSDVYGREEWINAAWHSETKNQYMVRQTEEVDLFEMVQGSL